jgi:hypothetical protein
MRVIFLDCDGVLNSQKFFKEAGHGKSMSHGLSFGASQLDPDALALVDQLVDKTGAKIVISSSWRHLWDIAEIIAMFEARGFRNVDAIIDRTGDSVEDHRGTEVNDWLELGKEREVVDDNHDPVTSYVILDDTDEFDTSQRQNFVRTNPQVGITPADIQRAYNILSQG